MEEEEEEEEGLEGARCVVASPSAAIVFLEGRNAAGLQGQVCVNVPRVPTIILTHTHARQKTHTHATQQTKTHPANTQTHTQNRKEIHTHTQGRKACVGIMHMVAILIIITFIQIR